MVGQWISNPSAVGTSIAIKGPAGTGKTTLVKEGISKILNREFAFIALGMLLTPAFWKDIRIHMKEAPGERLLTF